MSKSPRKPGPRLARRARAPLDEPVSASDQSLFRDAIGPLRMIEPVAPLPRSDPPAPNARMSEADERAVVDELLTHPLDALSMELGDPLRYLKAGTSPRLLRQLGRGTFAVRDEFDLHHMTAAVARGSLARFLDECIREQRLCVRIVHGKGLRSGSRGPVLKALVDQVLRRRGDVLAFRSAQSRDGGSGVVVALLRGRSSR